MSGNQIDPRAHVDPKAELLGNVTVEAFAFVGAGVVVGTGGRIGPHATLLGPTVLGPDCRVHAHAALGGAPQDRRYRGEPTRLCIGAEAIVREFATLHRGTAHDRGETRVGDRALVMAYAHVAHDCEVGDDVTLSNGAMLAGHVAVGPFAVLGGLAAVAQHLRVGESAFVAAGAMLERDAPPFCIVSGDRARVRGLNRVGLARRGLAPATIAALKRAYRILFRGDGTLQARIQAARTALPDVAEVARLLEFLEK